MNEVCNAGKQDYQNFIKIMNFVLRNILSPEMKSIAVTSQ